jgi:hypothetical protein
MTVRFHFLITALSIALQAMDLAVCAVGHHHEDDLVGSATETACGAENNLRHKHVGCCHHHHAVSDKDHEGESRPANSPAESHDDCSLCRHFSQPIVTVAIAIEVFGDTAVTDYAPVARPHVDCILQRIHDARGPPAICA